MQAQGCPVVRLGHVRIRWLDKASFGPSYELGSHMSAGSYIVEFDMPAYPGLYPSFPVFFPIPRPKGLRAFHKQLAATNLTGGFTSSFGYLIMGLAQAPVRPPAVCIRISS